MESFQHNQVKLAVAVALNAKAQRENRGVYFTDGMLLSLPGCERTYMPDGFFVSFRQLRAFCRFKRNRHGGVHGVLGVPSIIIEVASPTRLAEDYDDKREEYQRAGVREFWLFRPDGISYRFDLLTLDRRGSAFGWVARPESAKGVSSPDSKHALRIRAQSVPPARMPEYYRQRPEGQGGYSKVLRQYARLLVQPTVVPGLSRYLLQLSDQRAPTSGTMRLAA